MLNLLIRLMVLVALAQFGLSLTHISRYKSRECLMQLEMASHEVLKIDWKPISVFPEEARKFR
jgi:hypothetical protein